MNENKFTSVNGIVQINSYKWIHLLKLMKIFEHLLTHVDLKYTLMVNFQFETNERINLF